MVAGAASRQLRGWRRRSVRRVDAPGAHRSRERLLLPPSINGHIVANLREQCGAANPSHREENSSNARFRQPISPFLPGHLGVVVLRRDLEFPNTYRHCGRPACPVPKIPCQRCSTLDPATDRLMISTRHVSSRVDRRVSDHVGDAEEWLWHFLRDGSTALAGEEDAAAEQVGAGAGNARSAVTASWSLRNLLRRTPGRARRWLRRSHPALQVAVAAPGHQGGEARGRGW
jgi:hypothetical protein